MAVSYKFILHLNGPDIKQDIPLQQGTTTVGREPGNALVLSDPLISRRHARFDCTQSECTITDLNSANGTLVNGKKLTVQVPVPLENKAAIKIGPFEITFEMLMQEIEEDVSQKLQTPDKGQPVEAVEPSLQTKNLAPKPKPVNVRQLSDQGSGIPPATIPPIPPILQPPPEKKEQIPPPGLTFYSTRLINYLPGIYQDDFTSRFLALFESILIPIEWNVDNFDLFLNPTTTPADFLPWLMNWFQISFDSTWRDDQKRKLLKEAGQIFARRGSKWAVTRTLEIYLDQPPEIIEFGEDLNPYTFKVKIPLSKNSVNQGLIEQLINFNKPAYTSYTIEFQN